MNATGKGFLMFKVVVFDAYGTLFDVYSIGALADSLYPGSGQAIATLCGTSKSSTPGW